MGRDVRLAGSIALALIAALGGSDSRAQTPTFRFTSEFDPKNFAHAAWLGSGIYSVDGRQIYIVRFSVGIPLRSEDEQPWGLRLTLRPTAGFYDFRTSDSDKFGLPGSIGSLSVLPGVEFRVPVGSSWRLDPFLELGPAMEFERDTVTWIYGLGVRGRGDHEVAGGRLLLWPALTWAGNWESNISPADDFAVLEATLEWRHPVGWTFFGHPTDMGPWLRGEFYFNKLVAEPPAGEPLDLRHRYEVGATWGPVEKSKKWIVPLPRLGLAVRFGDGDFGYRLIFSALY